MTSAANKIGLSVVLVTMMPIGGWSANTSADMNASIADIGEKTAVEYRADHPVCSTVPQYGNQVRPIGRVTGDPEKDTVAYPVERVQSECPSNQIVQTGRNSRLEK